MMTGDRPHSPGRRAAELLWTACGVSSERRELMTRHWHLVDVAAALIGTAALFGDPIISGCARDMPHARPAD